MHVSRPFCAHFRRPAVRYRQRVAFDPYRRKDEGLENCLNPCYYGSTSDTDHGFLSQPWDTNASGPKQPAPDFSTHSLLGVIAASLPLALE